MKATITFQNVVMTLDSINEKGEPYSEKKTYEGSFSVSVDSEAADVLANVGAGAVNLAAEYMKQHPDASTFPGGAESFDCGLPSCVSCAEKRGKKN